MRQPPVALDGEQVDPLMGLACDAESNQALLLPSRLQETPTAWLLDFFGVGSWDVGLLWGEPQ